MRDQLYRILFFAGTGLLAGAIVYGSPAVPGVFAPVHNPVGLRLAEAATVISDVAPVAVQRPHARSSASAKPNPASCPGQDVPGQDVNGQPPESPATTTAPAAGENSAGIAPGPASSCPGFGTGSDAQTNIARGQALAQPVPLNSKQLITPPRH